MISHAVFLNGGLSVLTRSTPKPAVVMVFAEVEVAVFAHGAVDEIRALTRSPLRLC